MEEYEYYVALDLTELHDDVLSPLKLEEDTPILDSPRFKAYEEAKEWASRLKFYNELNKFDLGVNISITKVIAGTDKIEDA